MNKDSFIFSENSDFQNKALYRFVKYAKINSQSDGEKADNGIFPSTPQQKDFAKLLVEELKTLGVEASIKNECYVYAFIEGTGSKQNEESICLLAHIDKSVFQINAVYDISVSLVDENCTFMCFPVNLGALHCLQ